MLQLAQEFLLVHNRVDTALGYDSGFGHLLHGEELLLSSELDLPNFSKASPTDHIVELEVVFVYCCTSHID